LKPGKTAEAPSTPGVTDENPGSITEPMAAVKAGLRGIARR
jgi:hypothetical protein